MPVVPSLVSIFLWLDHLLKWDKDSGPWRVLNNRATPQQWMGWGMLPPTVCPLFWPLSLPISPGFGFSYRTDYARSTGPLSLGRHRTPPPPLKSLLVISFMCHDDYLDVTARIDEETRVVSLVYPLVNYALLIISSTSSSFVQLF